MTEAKPKDVDAGGGEETPFEPEPPAEGSRVSACLALALLPAALHAWVRLLVGGSLEALLALLLGGPVVLLVLGVLARAYRVAPRTLGVPLALAGFLAWPWLACLGSGLQGLVDPALLPPEVHGPTDRALRGLATSPESFSHQRSTERLGLDLDGDLRLLRIREFLLGEGDTEILAVVDVSAEGTPQVVSSVSAYRSCHDCAPSALPLIQSLPIRPNVGDTFFVEHPAGGSRHLGGAPATRTHWTSGLVQVRPDGTMEPRSPLLAALPLLALYLGPLLLAAAPLSDRRAKTALSLLWVLAWFTVFYGPALP